jgi:hypothetical protein
VSSCTPTSLLNFQQKWGHCDFRAHTSCPCER